MTRITLAVAAVVVAAFGLPATPASAQVRGGVVVAAGPGFHGGGHWGGHGWGPRWGTRVGIGIGIGFGVPLYYGGPYYGGYAPYYGDTVLVAPPVAYGVAAPVPAAPPMTQPEPVFYPRNGQSAAQAETDRRDCNRWAIGQQSAMADATVFHRATLACMEGRGYTVR